MTRPGYVQPTAPGWWVRTGRIGMINTAYRWDTTVEGILHPVGTAEGDYAYAGSATGIKPTAQVTGHAIAQGGTVTLPAHESGDLILIWGYNGARNSTPPGAPAAGGTVPTWTTPSGGTFAGFNAERLVYAVATANNHTSGTFSGGYVILIAVVIRGANNSSPIGGIATVEDGSGTTITCPAITLARSDGTSVILGFGGSGDHVNGAGTVNAAPSGFTRLRDLAVGSRNAFCNQKNVTTSDGASVQSCSSAGWGVGMTVEIKSPT